MDKITKRIAVDFDFDWTYGVEIKKLREDLDALEKLGVKSVEIKAEESYGSASVIINAYVYREETDEEFNTRMRDEEYKKEKQKEYDLETIKKLQARYNIK